MSSLARLVSDNFGSLEKLELRVPSSPVILKETAFAWGPSFVRGYLRVRFDTLDLLTSEI